MKKMVVTFGLFLGVFCSAGLAQNTTKTTLTSASSHKAKKPGTKKITSAKIETMNNPTRVIPDNRKEYMQNGQLATWTGHQAAPTNGDEYVAVKDSANKKRKKQQPD